MCKKLISRESLHRQLVRTAQVRSAVSMLSFLLLMPLLGLLPKEWIASGPAVPIVLFGGFLAISWAMTEFYCKLAVPCPNCGKSLWCCGTGNFKPRRMQVRREAVECPHCHVPIV